MRDLRRYPITLDEATEANANLLAIAAEMADEIGRLRARVAELERMARS